MASKLSECDQRVLDMIFDPLQLLSSSPSDLKPSEEAHDEIENKAIADLVKQAVTTAESGNLDEALQMFNDALEQIPENPTVLNDRAQALRLAGRVDEAMRDLNLAVDISKGQGQSGTKALCQRGLLHRLAGREDDAILDFKVAAQNGSVYARSQLVHMNPYAAMCNAMLKKMNFQG